MILPQCRAVSRRGAGGARGLALLFALLLSCSYAAPSHAGSGKVPVEGALAASDTEPRADGDEVFLYFNVTPLVDCERLTLEIGLPAGVETAESTSLSRSFNDVAAGATAGMTVAVRVRSPSEKLIIATATIADDADLVLSRSFALYLNREQPTASRGRPGTDADGAPLIIFDSGE